MANDVVNLLKALGVGRVALVGHDRGARVATRLVKDHSDLVDRLVVMDNVPTRIVAREMNAKVAREYWFFMFHQIPNLPEALIAGREEIWLRNTDGATLCWRNHRVAPLPHGFALGPFCRPRRTYVRFCESPRGEIPRAYSANPYWHFSHVRRYMNMEKLS
jgi:pimeloyl-ACP methyl ester carboxylesterase